MSSSTILQVATVDDLETILSLNHELFKFETRFSMTYNLDWTHSDRGKEVFLRRLASEEGIVLIAKDKDKAIGYICGYVASFSFRSINPIATIENMFVQEGYRGRKIGSVLIKDFRKRAREKGAKRIRVDACYENQTAIQFYKSSGMDEFILVLEGNL